MLVGEGEGEGGGEGGTRLSISSDREFDSPPFHLQKLHSCLPSSRSRPFVFFPLGQEYSSHPLRYSCLSHPNMYVWMICWRNREYNAPPKSTYIRDNIV